MKTIWKEECEEIKRWATKRRSKNGKPNCSIITRVSFVIYFSCEEIKVHPEKFLLSLPLGMTKKDKRKQVGSNSCERHRRCLLQLQCLREDFVLAFYLHMAHEHSYGQAPFRVRFMQKTVSRVARSWCVICRRCTEISKIYEMLENRSKNIFKKFKLN